MTDPTPRRGARHAAKNAAKPAASPALVAGIVGALVVLGGGGWAIAKAFDSGRSSAASSSSSVSTAAVTQASTTAGPSSSDAPTTAPSTTSTTSDATSAALTACRDQVRAGQALAAVAAPLAQHWSQHTSAQTQVDSGKITADQAKKIWADSKKAGPGDVSSYKSALAAYQGKAKGCDAGANAAPADATALQQCRARNTALSGVASGIAPVEADWASHLEAMKTKASHEANMTGYWSAWYTLVDRAPARLKAYDTAAKALQSAPSCPGV